jgi:cell division septation protein DedD
MPKIEPVYEPRDHDMGAFDGGDDDMEQEDEGSRMPLLLVIGLLVLVAFAGVVWLAYQHGVERGMRDAPRAVAGDQAPATSQDYNKIYQKPAPSDEDSANDDTAPPPPTFKPQPAPTTPAPSTTTTTTAPAPSTPVPATPAPSALAKSTKMAAATPVAPPPVPASAQPQATKPPAKLVPDTQAAQTTTTETKPAETIPPPSTSAPSTPAPAASGGDYVLQIGAYKSQDEASSSWKTYKAKHSIAAAYAESIKQVDLGAKGTWYRLRINGFASKDAATAFCTKLKAGGGDCIPAKN